MIIRTTLVAKMHTKFLISASAAETLGKEQLTAFFCGAAAALKAASLGADSGGEEAFVEEFERLLLVSFPGAMEPADDEFVH